MHCINCFLGIFVFVNGTSSVKINVEGSISLGKDVMHSLSQFLDNTYKSGARRSMVPTIEEDPITGIVRTAVLCRKFAFCLNLRAYIEEFLTVLAMSLQRVLSELLGKKFKEIVFEEQLKHYLEIVRNILEQANSKVTEENEVYYWINTIKKICARFQEMASILVTEELEVDQNEVNRIKSDLNQKLVIAMVIVETKYQTKLCVDYNICIKSYEVTKSLNTLLKRFTTMPEDKVKQFIRYFYEALFETAFYTHVSEKTAHELQVILNDMAYSNEVPTKDLLSNVQKVVAERLDAIEKKKDENLSHDVLLLHAILSDIDHVYGVYKSDPFYNFFQHFYDWLVDDIRIDKEIRQIVKDIGNELRVVSDDMFIKVTSEVRVFLEITVDPEK